MDKKTMLECLINHYTDGNKAAFARMLTITPQVLSQWLINCGLMPNIFAKAALLPSV